MDFYKKLTFSILAFLFCFAVMIKLVEPVIERQVSNIFADKKLSKKLMREIINSAEDFTPEKRELYKDIVKKCQQPLCIEFYIFIFLQLSFRYKTWI